MVSNGVARDDSDPTVPALARLAVETFVTSGHQLEPPPGLTGILAQRAACFVSIKTKDGELRGCIGTIEPAKQTLAEEIIMNAISAAYRDPRFSPVLPNELPGLVYSVDVLAAPEPTKFEDLDPNIYGVIVEDEAGRSRGLLLPAIAGVETAELQVQIAAKKAGLLYGTPLKLWRFEVSRYKE